MQSITLCPQEDGLGMRGIFKRDGHSLRHGNENENSEQ